MMNMFIKECINTYGHNEAREIVDYIRCVAKTVACKILNTREAKVGMYVNMHCFIPADYSRESEKSTFIAIANECGKYGVERHWVDGILYGR